MWQSCTYHELTIDVNGEHGLTGNAAPNLCVDLGATNNAPQIIDPGRYFRQGIPH